MGFDTNKARIQFEK